MHSNVCSIYYGGITYFYAVSTTVVVATLMCTFIRIYFVHLYHICDYALLLHSKRI